MRMRTRACKPKGFRITRPARKLSRKIEAKKCGGKVTERSPFKFLRGQGWRQTPARFLAGRATHQRGGR